MKKYCISFLTLLIISVSLLGVYFTKRDNARAEYLRLHIRANSNLDIDQSVKYKVKDKIVEFLTPIASECTSRKRAEELLNDNLGEIEKVADKVLKENGYEYTSKAQITDEHFPTRKYQNLTLEEGIYKSLIINLGSGEGDNWWCVVYPPLCFVGSGTNYVYKSKILQIIDDFKSKNKE